MGEVLESLYWNGSTCAHTPILFISFSIFSKDVSDLCIIFVLSSNYWNERGRLFPFFIKSLFPCDIKHLETFSVYLFFMIPDV